MNSELHESELHELESHQHASGLACH